MKIGEKIKKLRGKTKQSAIYPTNQSMVSQIEKGINKHPTEQTLRIMAKNLDVSFEELIKDTDWEQSPHSQTGEKFAISHTECVITIEDSGIIKTKMKAYDRYNKSGEENQYDPDTGYKLLTECKNCKREIESPIHAHCFGCGTRVFPDVGWIYYELQRVKYYDEAHEEIYQDFMMPFGPSFISEYLEIDFTIDSAANKNVRNSFISVLSQKLQLDSVLNNPSFSYSQLLGELKKDGRWNEYSFVGADGEGYYHDRQIVDEKGKTSQGIINLESFRNIKPNRFDNETVEKWWINFKFEISCCRGMIDELLRHQQKIIELEKEKEKSNDEKLSEPKQKKEKNS